MTKIVITGVDGSDTAAQAAHTAAEIADAFNGELHVLCAYGKLKPDTVVSGSEQYVFATAVEAERTALSTVADLKASFPGLAITSTPSEGKPGDALIDAAVRLGADLIVVGNKRVQGISRALGSVAKDVATHAKCDVYVAYTHPR